MIEVTKLEGFCLLLMLLPAPLPLRQQQEKLLVVVMPVERSDQPSITDATTMRWRGIEPTHTATCLIVRLNRQMKCGTRKDTLSRWNELASDLSRNDPPDRNYFASALDHLGSILASGRPIRTKRRIKDV